MAPCTVFVVEDDVDTRDMMGRFLELEGFTVEVAANGKQALERLNAGVHPCVILLDLMMPVMDGWQFAAELRRHEAWREIPVIVVTAKDLSLEERRTLNGDVQGVLQKGALSRTELLREIHDLMATSGRPDSAR